MKNSAVALCVLFLATQAFAQITVTGLTEMQRGEVPGADTTAISTVYNQLNVDVSQRGFQAGLRAEVYNVWGDNREIYQITQKYARWTQGPLRVEVGNYYAMLGRGLTLRAFELSGVVLESNLYRLRYAPTQDLEGAFASWTQDRLELKALLGRPLIGDIPPDAKAGNPPRTIERREEWVSGGELAVRPLNGLRLGGTILNINPKDPAIDPHWTWSGFGELDISPLFGNSGYYGSFYGEYARRQTGPKGHGLYLSSNLGNDRIGLSIEYKNYDNLDLSANDPPSLIREHTAFLLNRATHVLLTLKEKGYQVEGTYYQPSWGTLTANVSHAQNDLAPTVSTIFKERHFAFDLDRFAPIAATVFFNWGKDDLEGIDSRRIGGVVLENTTQTGQTLGLDLQHQRATRPFGSPSAFNDTYAALTWQHPRGFGAALTLDHTTDPFEVDRPETRDIVETGSRTFWAVNLNARLAQHYDIVVFAGERRGGTACTSGTCYQVLPFKGVEMRINTFF